MIRFLLRLCGTVLLAAGVAAFVADASRSLADAHVGVTSLQQALRWFGDGAPAAVGAAETASAFRDLLLWAARTVPVFAMLVAAGALLLIAGRPRAPGIGVIRR